MTYLELRRQAERKATHWYENDVSDADCDMHPETAFEYGFISGYSYRDPEVGKLRDALEKFRVQPYPETVFLPISDEEYTAIHEVLLEKFNMPIDRLAGHIGRELRKGIIEEAQQALKS